MKTRIISITMGPTLQSTDVVNDKTNTRVTCVQLPTQMDGTCSECGKPGDMRPYGHKGALICFECATSPQFQARTEHNIKIKTFCDPGELL